VPSSCIVVATCRLCFVAGLWKVAVVTGVHEPQLSDASQQQHEAPPQDSQEGTDATGESEERRKPPSVNERRDKVDDKQAEQQSQQPENQSEEDKTRGDAQNDNKEQVEDSPHEAPCAPTCRLVMVLYGDQGQTEPLLLDDNVSISAVKFQPGIADTFIVSECANMAL